MITLSEIKQILFADEAKQAAFIAETNDCDPPIPGENFDEKFTNFFQTASDRNLQLVLAPFLRARIFKYLNDGETEYARGFKKEFIEVNGNQYFAQMCEGNIPYELARIANDFLSLKTSFIHQRGNEIWEAVHNSNLDDADYTPHIADYSAVKQQFVEALPESVSPELAQTIWVNMHQVGNDSLKSFDAVKQAYIQDWGEALWQENCCVVDAEPRIPTLSPDLTMEPTTSSLNFPAAPDPVQNFIQKKEAFIETHGRDAWNAAVNLPPNAFSLADQLKTKFMLACGTQQWSRIMSPPIIIKRFEELKKSIYEPGSLWQIYGHQDEIARIWDFCCGADPCDLDANPDIDPAIKADFDERKKRFVEESSQRYGVVDAWQKALAYPPIPPKSQMRITNYKKIFVSKWGTWEWDNYLATHNSREWATAEQIKVLAKIFHFELWITDISNNRPTGHYLSDLHDSSDLSLPNRPKINFYCENNSHYYIHEGGYSETEGNGDCFYNGFAQWLRLLVKGQEPRRILVLPDTNDTDVDSFVAIQKTLLPADQTNDSVISLETSPEELQQIASAEEISINAIRKELGLSLPHGSNKAFAKFIQAKVNALIHLIRAKQLPFSNRIALLQKISKLAEQFSKQTTSDSNLVKLQVILLHIVNTTYLPHGKDVDANWSMEAFKNNIQALQEKASELSSDESFTDLSTDILATDFNCNTPENIFARIMNQPTYSPARSNYAHAAETEEDWLSATLCIAGIFMMITSILFMISLLWVAALSGLTALGLFLMQNSFIASISLSLGAVIGLSAPNTAILLATGASFVTAGVGFTMFKDFAPRQLPSLDSFLPNLNMF